MNSPDTDPGDVLDLAVIDSLRQLGGDDDPGLLDELIDLFLTDAPTHLDSIASGLAAGDADSLERAAHTLKSSCANIGALELSELFRELEERGRSRELDATASLVTRAQSEYARVQAALEQIRT